MVVAHSFQTATISPSPTRTSLVLSFVCWKLPRGACQHADSCTSLSLPVSEYKIGRLLHSLVHSLPKHVCFAMAATLFCENDTLFDNLNHPNVAPAEITGIGAILHEELCVDESFRPNEQQFLETESLQWRDSAPFPQYGAFKNVGSEN